MTPPRPPRNWLVIATVAAPILIAVILFWQLLRLDPSRWCGVALGSGKVADVTNTDLPKACFQLLTDMLGIYRQNTLALIIILGVSLITIVITTLGARVDLAGFGFHGNFGGGDGPPSERPGDPVHTIEEHNR